MHYVARSPDRVKLLVWDGSGLTLIYKRLDQARFVWPRIEDGVMRLSPGQLGALVRGARLEAGAQPSGAPPAARAMTLRQSESPVLSVGYKTLPV